MSFHRAKFAEIAGACVFVHLRKASRAATQFYDQGLAPSGLRVTQFSVLVAIAAAEESTVTSLAETLTMDRTTLSRNLALLSRKGLVKIRSSNDRRVRVVTLTAAGRAALSKAVPLWARTQSLTVARLGEARWNLLRRELATTMSLV